MFRVEAVGTQVSKVRVGDHALCLGSHQAFQRRRENEIARVPDGLPPDQAVFARLMGVSMATLTTTAARPPARVVVTGLGPVGYLAAALFAACGYRVCACDPDERRRALTASRLPHVYVVPAPPLEDAAWAGETALVIECSGHERAALDGCRIVAKGGEVVLVGVPWARRADDLSAHDLLHAVFHRYVVLRSGWEWELPRHPTEFRPGSVWGNLEGALRWLADGKILVDVYSLYAPADCQSAYQNLLLGREPRLAVVFDWQQHQQRRLTD